ncbi:uncharacterized protein LOC141915419 isoform X2 [Tubulanus polymorphus]|uniref:uncharacterized protein LOC141915419 isoform X2 n=1 Tax=Tubulanus polymorphus TaxID=672921 RepID=UPI003DA5BA8B
MATESKDQIDVAPARARKPWKPTNDGINLLESMNTDEENEVQGDPPLDSEEIPRNTETLADDVRNEPVGAGDPGQEDVQGEGYEKEEDTKLETDEQLDRDELFYKARGLEKSGKLQLALKYYLKCLKSLEKNTPFSFMPQCLNSVANIYYSLEEYEKAVQFIQAEKLYYETALIDSSGIQKKIEAGLQPDDKDSAEDVVGLHGDVIRAEEYENLARLCLEKNQPQLALEYCGKATKLRQQIFGENHPLTLKSLDFFTVVYAEAGKEQYQESMDQLNSNMDMTAESESRPSTSKRTPDSELRKRPVNKESQINEDQIPEASVSTRTTVKTHEEQISISLLWVFFFILLCVLCMMGVFLSCRMNPHDEFCATVKTKAHYYLLRLKYYYYRYTDDVDNVSG